MRKQQWTLAELWTFFNRWESPWEDWKPTEEECRAICTFLDRVTTNKEQMEAWKRLVVNAPEPQEA